MGREEMGTWSWRRSFLILVVLAAVPLHSASAKKAKAAIEVTFKERITSKLEDSLSLSASHLVHRLSKGPAGHFGGYDLLVPKDDSERTWVHGCHDIGDALDSVENCAIRKLNALAALCDIDGISELGPEMLEFLNAHLNVLKSGQASSLGIEIRKLDRLDVWFHATRPQHDGRSHDVDVSPAVQASALAAMVRCANATNQKKYLEEAEVWFGGLTKTFPPHTWKSTSFHKNGIVWESLALVGSHLPEASSFYAALQEFILNFESFVKQAWDEDANAWSFASARALAIRARSRATRNKKQRSKIRKWAQEHINRFLGRSKSSFNDGDVSQGILQRIGGMGYTCGPLQGLSSLATVLMDSELLQVILKLMEKDVQTYQVGVASAESSGLASEDVDTRGSFFRNQQQLELEKRNSLRVDDTVMCVVALTQTLRMLDGVLGVSMPVPEIQDTDEEANSEEL